MRIYCSHQHHAATRTFLFLQGPHGPFFAQLARALRRAGAGTRRVGFNRGDQAFWGGGRADYISHTDDLIGWPDRVAQILDAHQITDLVVYGDTRPIHAAAVRAARSRGITVHVFEEGYLRPYWVTYERDGANGYSPVMSRSVDQMTRALGGRDLDMREAPARWGALRQHVFYGALYHGLVLLANRRYVTVRQHRDLTVAQEFALYLKRLALMPAHWLGRVLATQRIVRGAFPYHLALLQLEHDASVRDHGPFASQSEFVRQVIEAFAQGAPDHHHLVFKAHPLEDGRVPLCRDIARIASEAGIAQRTHFVRGGKLAFLLDRARSAVTVNSTAAQQALWRGLPLKAFGRAVYDKPEFVSDQPLPAFFANPDAPDSHAYRIYRHYLMETSQISGSYYAAKGRRELLRQVVDLMLSVDDAYSVLDGKPPARRQHLSAVR